jgi:Ni2+-binding GTPase involved in maturation of urease and hydrogenase
MQTPTITVTVHGPVGTGKSSIILECMEALRNAGITCVWSDEVEELHGGTGLARNIEVKPVVVFAETNPAMQAAQGVQG